jgi:hypothetical protein
LSLGSCVSKVTPRRVSQENGIAKLVRGVGDDLRRLSDGLRKPIH